MKHTPANVISEHASGPNRLVELFLARLLGYLLRLHHTGQSVVPAEIVSMVRSADAMVDACIPSGFPRSSPL